MVASQGRLLRGRQAFKRLSKVEHLIVSWQFATAQYDARSDCRDNDKEREDDLEDRSIANKFMKLLEWRKKRRSKQENNDEAAIDANLPKQLP